MIQSFVIHASAKNTIARLTVACAPEAKESAVSLTTPVGQQATFYVGEGEKVRFIKELRAALDAWEKAP